MLNIYFFPVICVHIVFCFNNENLIMFAHQIINYENMSQKGLKSKFYFIYSKAIFINNFLFCILVKNKQ